MPNSVLPQKARFYRAFLLPEMRVDASDLSSPEIVVFNPSHRTSPVAACQKTMLE
jgi:hypothetical protein